VTVSKVVVVYIYMRIAERLFHLLFLLV